MKTFVSGAQIIDLMLLVVDVVKGLQTQTAECLVIGEITCSKMIVVLNKVDLLPVGKKDNMIDKVPGTYIIYMIKGYSIMAVLHIKIIRVAHSLVFMVLFLVRNDSQ